MDNKYFDKIFSNKLQETQSFDFRESDWEAVSDRLKEPKRKKRGGIWFWMLGAACLLLGLTTAYLAYDLNITKQELAGIQETIIQQSNDNSTTNSNSINKSTKKITNSTQTITTEEVIDKNYTGSARLQDKEATASALNATNSTAKPAIKTKNNRPTKTNNIASTNTKLKNTQTPNSVAPIIESTNSAASNSSNLIINAEKNIDITAPIETDIDIDIDIAIPIDIPIAISSTSAFPLAIGEEEIQFEPTPVISSLPLIKKAANQKNRFGITAGWSLPERLVSQSSSDNSSLKRNAYDVGLHYSYDVTKKINTWASLSFHTTSYKTRNFNGASSRALLEQGSFVVLNSINEDAIAQGQDPALADGQTSDVSARQNVLRYSLGANYNFLQKPRWGLYAGLSAHAQTKIKNIVLINDEDDDNGNGAFVDSYDSESNGIKEAFRFHSLATQVGYRFDINKQLSWQVEAYSQLKLAPKSNRIYEPFGLRTVVAYRF